MNNACACMDIILHPTHHKPLTIGINVVHSKNNFLHAVKACEVTTWMEDAQGKKKATHSISASLKPDGSREHRMDGKIKSSKEVKVSPMACSALFDWTEPISEL